MDPVAALVELGGFATRAGLVAHGVSRHQVSHAFHAGRIVRLQRGVYGIGLAEGKQRLAAAVVALRAVATHESAAVLWNLEMVHVPAVRVTVPRNRSRASFQDVRVCRATVSETVVRSGLPVTSALRTILDCARVLSLEEAVVIADSALRRGLVTTEELHTAAGRVRGRNAARIRRMVALTDARCGSVLESLLRVLLTERGMPPPRTQLTIRGVAIVDFAWPAVRLIVEADGFEFHRERSDYRKDRRKANAFCRLDWRLLRFSWEDVRHDPGYVVDAVRHELTKPVAGTRYRPTDTQRAA